MEGERLSTKTAHLLRTAAVTPDHFKNLGNQHTYEFGAIAEFLDNAVDASATSVHINIEPHELSYAMTFLDDGVGMSREECTNIAVLGESKKAASNKIGRFGTGLKSGAMKLGEDFVLFTKKNGCLSCIYMGTSASRITGIQQIAVAVPSFDEKTLQPVEENIARHKLEMRTILDYSPFRTSESFFRQFSRIPGSSGTLLVVYNFHLNPSGSINFDFESFRDDICVKDHFPIREYESLREYLSILYLRPTMKIYLRNKKVITERLMTRLYNTRQYKIETKLFRGSAASSLQKREFALDRIRQESNRVKGEMSALCISDRSLSQAERQRLSSERLRKEQRNESLTSLLYLDSMLTTAKYGMMLYSNGRLIKMYEKMPSQDGKTSASRKKDEWQYLGVLCLLDIPYTVVEPSVNKESLATEREFKGVLRLMNDYLQYFWEEQMQVFRKEKIASSIEFWTSMGYSGTEWLVMRGPMKKEAYKKTGFDVQCENCGKWRILPYTQKLFESKLPDDWRCEDNPNPSLKSCNKPETIIKIKEGKKLPIESTSAPPPSKSDRGSRVVKIKEELGRQTLNSVSSEIRENVRTTVEPQYRQHASTNRAFVRMSLINPDDYLEDSDDMPEEDIQVVEGNRISQDALKSRSLKRSSSNSNMDLPTKKISSADKIQSKKSNSSTSSDVITLDEDVIFRIPKVKREFSSSQDSDNYSLLLSSNDFLKQNVDNNCSMPCELSQLLEFFAEKGSSTARDTLLGAGTENSYREIAAKIYKELAVIVLQNHAIDS